MAGSGGYFRNWWVPMTSTRRTDNAQAILAAPRSRILHRCRAAPERRPRASERDPRAKNPFLTPTAPLSASRQPSPRPPRVSRRRLVESCARGGENREGDLGAPAFRVLALRCAGPQSLTVSETKNHFCSGRGRWRILGRSVSDRDATSVAGTRAAVQWYLSA